MAGRAGRRSKGGFSGHETFPFRYAWLKKAFDAVHSNPTALASDDAIAELGVGANMVRSMRHWALACGIVREADSLTLSGGAGLRVTEIGSRLLSDDGWDPYLEDPASIWWLHWQLATNEDRAPSWFYVFNCMSKPEFSKAELADAIRAWAEKENRRVPALSTVRRDVDCLIRMYVATPRSSKLPIEDTLDCPIAELGLIREFESGGLYRLDRGDPPNLPDEIVVYGLLKSLEAREGNAQSVRLEEVAYGKCAPGQVFCLSEHALLPRIERLESITNGALIFDDTAGLRQILVRARIQPEEMLEAYYGRRVAGQTKMAS